jgi:HEAT repeat protein
MSLREQVEADHYPQIQRGARELSRGTPHARRLAARSLGRTRDERAVSPLLRGASDQDGAVRLAAAQALGEFGTLPEWAAGPLSWVLRDPDPCVRQAAAHALRGVRTHSASEYLIAAVRDRCASVRAAAAEGLSGLGGEGIRDDDAILPLIDLLNDADDHVAYQAYWALGAQGGSLVDAVRAAWRWSGRGQDVWASMVRAQQLRGTDAPDA